MVGSRCCSLLTLVVICNASFLKPTSPNLETKNQAAIKVNQEVKDLRNDLEVRCMKINLLFEQDGSLAKSPEADNLRQLNAGIDAKVRHRGSLLSQLLDLREAKKNMDRLDTMISAEMSKPTQIVNFVSSKKTTLASNPNQMTEPAKNHSTAVNLHSTVHAQDSNSAKLGTDAKMDIAAMQVMKELGDLQHEMDAKSKSVRRLFGPEGALGNSKVTDQLKKMFTEFESQAHPRGPMALRLRMLRAAKKSFRNLSQSISAHWLLLTRDSNIRHQTVLMEVMKTLNEN